MSTAAPASPPTDARTPPPRLLMTRAEFEAADRPGTRVEWLGMSGETRGGEPLGVVWPVHGFNPDGSFAMASPQHSEIVANLMETLFQTVGRNLWIIGTQDVEVGLPTGRSRFPDVALARRPARYAPGARGTDRILLTPAAAFEVRSDSTVRVDEEDKPADYLSVDTLTDYVLIDQTRPHVAHRRRADAVPARWDLTFHDDLADRIELSAPAVSLTLAEIYARVFPAA